MIIVIKDADFSANNIGKVNVNSLNEFTLAAIEASGNDTLTDTQKYALNAFFDTIGAWSTEENTIFSRMNVIYLPILAKDVAHSMINYVNNTIPQTSGNVDVTPSGTAIIRNGGLVCTDYTTPPKRAKISRVWTGEFSLLWLRTEKFDSTKPTTKNSVCFVREQPSNTTLIDVYETNAPSNSRSTVAAGGINVNGDFLATNYANDLVAAQGFTIRSSGDAYSIYNGLATSRNWSLLNSFTPVETSWFETAAFCDSKYNDSASIGVVMFGKALTNAEMDAVAAAINGLRDAFLA